MAGKTPTVRSLGDPPPIYQRLPQTHYDEGAKWSGMNWVQLTPLSGSGVNWGCHGSAKPIYSNWKARELVKALTSSPQMSQTSLVFLFFYGRMHSGPYHNRAVLNWRQYFMQPMTERSGVCVWIDATRPHGDAKVVSRSVSENGADRWWLDPRFYGDMLITSLAHGFTVQPNGTKFV